MKTYISILRGINVGGKNLIKMHSLKGMYESLGFNNIKTYIQSGNVIFQSNESQGDELERTIREEIFRQFSFNIPVLIREKTELKRILDQNPFREEHFDKLYITFLSSKPSKDCIEKIADAEFTSDKYSLTEKTVYLYCLNGYGKTKFTNSYFENKLKVNATTRNLKTLRELVKISDNI